MRVAAPYLLFLGNAADQLAAKTAQGVADWRRSDCIGQLRLPGCRADLGLPDLSIEEAARKGARTVIVGVANRGGVIGPAWLDVLERALDAGMDLASGLHERLSDQSRLRAAAKRNGRKLCDMRHPQQDFPVGTGKRRSGRRLLTVGTDCSVGKMYATLTLEREMRARGMNCSFRATGQTGILIAGSGVSVDAVIADFISGAAEWLTPANSPDHWDLVEGQGSLFHPSYAGVTLGLIHGAQPDALVLCHAPTRQHMRGLPHYALPPLQACRARCEEAAQLTNPEARLVGVCANTSGLNESEAEACLARIEDELNLPTVDPMRIGVNRIVDQIIHLFH